jgi:hypothetical protein
MSCCVAVALQAWPVNAVARFSFTVALVAGPLFEALVFRPLSELGSSAYSWRLASG